MRRTELLHVRNSVFGLAAATLLATGGCGSGETAPADIGSDASDVSETGDIDPFDVPDESDVSDVSDVPEDESTDVDSDAAVDADVGDTDPDSDPDSDAAIDADADTDAAADADVSVDPCGDGVLDEDEICDDGNRVDDDECTNECVLNIALLCRECIGDESCEFEDELCLDTGRGSFCVAPCDIAAADCVAGFACEAVFDADGAELGAACVPEPGVCFSCGDGNSEDGDACDDGNDVGGDGCSVACGIERGWRCEGSPSVCTPVCGNGLVSGTEACDDGETEAGDGCSELCEIEAGYECDTTADSPSVCSPVCGDGAVTGSETCDDSAEVDGDGCSASCAIEPGYYCSGAPSECATDCGDGIVAGTEACDDDGEDDGNGCSALCTVEAGFYCTGAPSLCATDCGDGIVAGTEACDDSAEVDGDGCSASCAIEPGFYCSGAPSECATDCGDGIVAGTELCDDNGEDDGDGCSALCTVEAGFYCAGAPSLCATDCGDGVVAGTEACDDAAEVDGDGCSAACAMEPGFYCAGAPSLCETDCGDGIVAGAESCDDNGEEDGDGCSASCAVERGFYCTGAPSLCETDCGDGLIAGAEECDDSAEVDGDGCSATCEVELGYACDLEPSICDTVCSDGIVAGAETCDDRDLDSGDGCSSECSVERGFDCAGAPSVCTTDCGDTITAGLEECDDGAESGGDGCSALCDVEPGYYCSGEPSACVTDCGDGVVAGAEQCDDGNELDRDACRSDCSAYRSCAHAREVGATTNGAYFVRADAAATVRPVYCDMLTDGGGWTLVGSTLNTTLNDQSSAWYTDLTTLAPAAANAGIWTGLRPLAQRFDVRFACRASVLEATAPFAVDLSFYDVPWYTEWTTGTDADSCFSENNGFNADSRVPARRDNIGRRFRRADDPYSGTTGYLEAEDTCGATDDFTVDFDDRGMDSNQSDGTDWGEDDGTRKCGASALAGGQWFVFARERPRVAAIGLSAPTTTALRSGGVLVDALAWDTSLPARITVENYDTIVIARYADNWIRMTQDLREALHVFARGGGNIVTEWDGASIFMSGYTANYRFTSGAPAPLGLFAGQIGGGQTRGSNTPVTPTAPVDAVFTSVPNPFSAGGATDFFFWLQNTTQLRQIATFPGGTTAFPNATYGAVYRGRHCGGNALFTTFDWNDDPTNAGFGDLIRNLVREANAAPPADLVDACQDQLRANVVLCGTSLRPISDFGITLAVTPIGSGLCTASDNTQAVFITRNGVSNLDVAGLRSYVTNGGIIITEFTSSDEVYNAIFNGAVVQGTRQGACSDNIMPSFQFSPSDSLWQDNRFVATSSANAGCGHDISAFPDIVRLGGHTADSTHLAYRDLGAGRVWFVESDWQDTQTSMTAASRGMMRHMFRHRGRGALDRGATFSGVRTAENIHDYLDVGFQPCSRTLYNQTQPLSEVLDACAGDVLMMACRQVGSPTFTVSAIGRRSEVLEDVGAAVATSNIHNGTNWYYSAARSWGFAPAAEAVNRNTCDTNTASGTQRLCWHTSADNLSPGFRCGTTSNLNGSTAWERIVLHRFGDLPPL
jgi:cysteine-rich repeat protein